MKKLLKSRTVLGALTAIALCVSLMTGATFAYFTSTSRVDVIVKSGKVNVTAEVTELSLYSPKTLAADGSVADGENIAEGGAFGNGGTARVRDGKLEISGITAGDKVTLTITVTDNGDVATAYRYGYVLLDGEGNAYDAAALVLFEGLNFTFDGESAKATDSLGSHLTVAYKTAYAALPQTKTVPVVVELPGTAGNRYQGLSLSIGFIVEAVQANVVTPDVPEKTVVTVANENLSSQIGAEGSTVTIVESGTIDSSSTIAEGVTVAGLGKDQSTLYVNKASVSKENVTIKDMTVIGSGASGNDGSLNISGNGATIENVDYVGESGKIAVTVSTGESNSGTTFRNTKITNAFRGIQFWNLSGNSVIDNCVLDIDGYTFNIDSATAGATLSVKNSVLNGWTSYTSGIALVTFENCRFGLNGYEYLRPYSETKIIGCEFTSEDYRLNAGGSGAYTVTIENCTKNGTAITPENVIGLLLDLGSWNANATLVVNGVTVTVA